MTNKPSSQLSNYLIMSKVIRADKPSPDAITITRHQGDRSRAVARLSTSRTNWRLFVIRVVYSTRLAVR